MEDQKQPTSENQIIQELQAKFAECEKLRDEYLAGWQRQKADFLNFKREQSEAAALLQDAIYRELVFAMLPLINDVDRAFSAMPHGGINEEWMRGFEQISMQFKKFLSTIGVEEIATDGLYNPEFHEAVGMAEAEGKEPGAILETIEKGYTLRGRVIKPAKVKIAK